jgi:amino acid transporter
MLTRTAQLLNARTLLTIAGVVFGLFVIAGIDATLFGQHPESDIADVIGTIAWIGWLLGAVVLIALAIVSLVAHVLTRRQPSGAEV